jgi:hypothetical protein
MTRPADPAHVASGSSSTSSWANSVVDAVLAILGDIYGASVLTIPWTALTGVPGSFQASLGAATPATTYGLAKADGTATTAARSDHIHGTPPLPTPSQVGAVASYTTPAAIAGGRRLYVGTSAPTGASEGDIWIKG